MRLEPFSQDLLFGSEAFGICLFFFKKVVKDKADLTRKAVPGSPS